MKDPANSVYGSLVTALEDLVALSYYEVLRFKNRVIDDSGTFEGESCVYDKIVALKDTSETALGVYNVMPEDVENGYIYLDDFLPSNEDLKDRFMHFGNINIQVIIPSSDPDGSRLNLNKYCEIVLNRLKPQVNSVLDLTPDFNNTYLYSTNIAEFTDNFDDGRTWRRVIRLTLGIEEL